MLAAISRMFRKSSPMQDVQASAKPEPVMYAPGTKIAYDGNLIGQLKDEHFQLKTLLIDIVEKTRANDHDGVQRSLNEFTITLRSHLLLENIKLYTYLQRLHHDDVDNAELIVQLRGEMLRIGRAVNGFLEKYKGVYWDEAKKRDFPIELDEMIAT